MSLFTIATISTFVACKKEVQTSTSKTFDEKSTMRQTFNYSLYSNEWSETTAEIPTDVAISDIMSSSNVQNILTTEGFSINSLNTFSTLTESNTGNIVYCVELSNSDPDINGGGIIIYPVDVAKKIYLVYLTKVVTSGSVNSRLIRSISSTGPYIDMDSEVADPSGIPVATKEQRAKFKGCMTAAWNDLTDNPLHAIGCNTMFAPICLAACVASCAHHLAGMATYGSCSSVTTTAEALDCLCDLELIDCTTTSASTSGYSFPTY